MSTTSPASMRRTIGGLAAAVALTVGVSACGASAGTGGSGQAVAVEAGSFSGAGGAELLRGSAAGTAEVTTLQVAATSTVSGLSGVGDLTVSVTGSVDREAGRARLAMHTDGMGALGEGLGDLETVVDGGTVYVRSELLRSFGGVSEPWAKIDAGDLTGHALGSVLGSGQTDPSDFLDLLEGVGGPVETVGTEDVRGVSTTHVKATLTVDELLADAPADHREHLEGLLEQLKLIGDDLPDVPVEAWVDADGLVRKLALTVDLGGVTGNAEVTESVELFAFGEPVTIDLPPADQVGELHLPGLGD